jgi:hypothetical protein
LSSLMFLDVVCPSPKSSHGLGTQISILLR